MTVKDLNICIIQPEIQWQDKVANLHNYSYILNNIREPKEVVVLPEMFNTGFSMDVKTLSETMEGYTVDWMRKESTKHRIILTGSLIIEHEEKFYNRLIWMQPDGCYGYYDKRHLFGYAGEDQHFTPGSKKLIVSVNGWKICPLICYDLRFPVFSRNVDSGYDVLLYVANWPEKRVLAWNTLLQARAIENQTFCIGVNRVGIDGNNHFYSGVSLVYDPLGQVIWQGGPEAVYQCVQLKKEMLNHIRSSLPFLKDMDRFILP